MSYLASEWASETAPVADTYERIILMKLASHANDDGCGAWPSIPSMARAAMCDTEVARRRLRAMQTRGLIALGDQRHVSHYRADRRPKVYDLLIPAEWYSEQQIAKLNQQRAEEGRELLTSANRPPLAPAPQKRKRSDAGKPNPKRSPKSRDATTSTTPMTEGPSNPVDNSHDPYDRGADDPSQSRATTPMTEGEIRPFKPVHEKTRPSDGNEQRAALASGRHEDGRTDNPEIENTENPRHAQPASAGVTAAKLVDDPELQTLLASIDVRPHQRKQLKREVERALLRFPAGKVATYLGRKLAEANTVKFLLTAFTEYADAIHDMPDAAAAEDQQHAEQNFLRQVAQAAPNQRSQARRSTTPVQPGRPLHDLSSPVSWLTDEQFAALSPQDRAHVRAAGETPVNELRPTAAKRIEAIRNAIVTAAA